MRGDILGPLKMETCSLTRQILLSPVPETLIDYGDA